jgi:hypothetical protein
MRFALIAFLNAESRDSLKVVGCDSFRRRKAFVDEKNAPAAGGWGASRAAGAGLDFGVTPDQDSAILRIQVGWSLFNFDHPPPVFLAKLSNDWLRIGGDEVVPNQAVWPSNSPVLGIFFACCGVIFAVSWPPGTPRGPSILRAISSSVSRCSSSRTWRGIGALHGALLNVLAFSCVRGRNVRERNAPW